MKFFPGFLPVESKKIINILILIKVIEFQNVLLVSSFGPKNNENIVRISALKVFIAPLGLPGSFLVLPAGFLVYDITY